MMSQSSMLANSFFFFSENTHGKRINKKYTVYFIVYFLWNYQIACRNIFKIYLQERMQLIPLE